MSTVDTAGYATPWAALGQRWGHPWHSMCSYLGTFPPALARSLIAMFTEPGDVVMDPFSGRGTTLLEARLLGRTPIASDLSPIAVALSRAKNTSVDHEGITNRIEELASGYDRLLHLPEAQVQPDEVQLIFHPGTLAQLCFLRRRLVNSRDPVDEFLVGALLGIMHGSERQDGTSSYASISMPNTFSMAPNYVRRFVATKQLNRAERDVFYILKQKAQRLFRESPPKEYEGTVTFADAKLLEGYTEMKQYEGRVKLVLTSPPYLDVVNYAKLNWIRCWLLERLQGDGGTHRLDDKLTLPEWLMFLELVVAGLKPYLTEDGVVVIVVGDVAKPGRSYISLARELIQRIVHNGTFPYVGCLDDYMGSEGKTTRIWRDSRGRATEVDRMIVLSNKVPTVNVRELVPALGLSDVEALGEFAVDGESMAGAARAFCAIE